ncbi:hypothetical protein [Bradyrhizobium genosp. P]|uniref:hypothetical protein n=1 Tax=Bradyrhizobium genosp. P TaxID=83641 RepID=UPI003CF45E5D
MELPKLYEVYRQQHDVKKEYRINVPKQTVRNEQYVADHRYRSKRHNAGHAKAGKHGGGHESQKIDRLHFHAPSRCARWRSAIDAFSSLFILPMARNRHERAAVDRRYLTSREHKDCQNEQASAADDWRATNPFPTGSPVPRWLAVGLRGVMKFRKWTRHRPMQTGIGLKVKVLSSSDLLSRR